MQTARANLAGTFHALGDLIGARALLEKAHVVNSNALPDDHPDLQVTRGNLAATIFALGDLSGAKALLEKVLDVFTRTLTDDHPTLQWARLNLAGTLSELGDLFGARMLQEKVLKVRSRTLPDDHPDLQLARGGLSVTIATELASGSRGADTDELRRSCHALIAACAHAMRSTTRFAVLENSGREAMERIGSLEGALGRVLSFADGVGGAFPSDPHLQREALFCIELMRVRTIAPPRLARVAGIDSAQAGRREERRAAAEALARLARGGIFRGRLRDGKGAAGCGGSRAGTECVASGFRARESIRADA